MFVAGVDGCSAGWIGFKVDHGEHWRSLYVSDPEGNQVELVGYDGNV